MAKEMKDYQLVEVYDQGTWSIIWEHKGNKKQVFFEAADSLSDQFKDTEANDEELDNEKK
jgi:sarcosine oxidase delta subunit